MGSGLTVAAKTALCRCLVATGCLTSGIKNENVHFLASLDAIEKNILLDLLHYFTIFLIVTRKKCTIFSIKC